MNAKQIKDATKIAQNYSIDLSNANTDILFGFGCPDFKKVTVSLEVVARCMRWQSSQMDGGWDWKQYNEDIPYYKKNVLIA